jgi:hypothetical protein
VWLVRDYEKRHGRYVALKIISTGWSEDYEPPGSPPEASRL